MKLLNIALASALVAGAATPSLAQTAEAMASTSLNVREAPSVAATVMGTLDTDQAVTIEGCLEDISWCRVNTGEMTGWASGQYLSVMAGSEPVALLDASGNSEVEFEVQTLTDADYTLSDDVVAATAGGTLGALTAYALGGPIGAIAASAAAGAVAGDVANDLTEPNYQYIVDNPVDTIYLDGEVVVGAAVPAEVTSYEIPDVTYRYLRVNNQPVIIDPETNAIVAVLR